jgi:hypothetical protein
VKGAPELPPPPYICEMTRRVAPSAERVLKRRNRERADRVRSERTDIFQGLVRNVKNGILATVEKVKVLRFRSASLGAGVLFFRLQLRSL